MSPDPGSVAVGWLQTLQDDPLKLFMGVVILALAYALVKMTVLHLAMLPKVTEATERMTAAIEALEKALHGK